MAQEQNVPIHGSQVGPKQRAESASRPLVFNSPFATYVGSDSFEQQSFNPAVSAVFNSCVPHQRRLSLFEPYSLPPSRVLPPPIFCLLFVVEYTHIGESHPHYGLR